MVHELGRSAEATDVLNAFVARKPMNFWDPSTDPFLVRDKLHPSVLVTVTSQAAKAAAKAAASFDLESALIEAAKSYDKDVIKKLSEIPMDQYYQLIKSKRRLEMRTIVLSGLDFRKISNATPEMLKVVRLIEEALMKIASESKLNAVRVRRYGVQPPVS